MADLFTDRSDASGTGYWSPTGGYRHDLLELALGHVPAVPRVAEPAERLGTATEGAVLAPGAGDNAAAALGLAAEPGDVIVSLGTSGVASAVSNTPSRDGAGVVAGFADATGRFLPLACTLNAAQVLDATADMLGVTHDRLSELALSAPSGCDGLVLVPYLQGERTPDRPFATGALHGLTLSTMSAAHFARASVEGMLCGVADALDALGGQGVPLRRVLLVGGAARSPAVQALAPVVFGCPVVVPAAADHVAEGAARQAAWVLSGDAQPPMWSSESHQVFEAEHDPSLRVRYAEAREHVLDRRRSES
jgi:xylulokinase